MNGFEVVPSWLTPTVIFCVLNLVIGTIFLIQGLKPHNKAPKSSENDALSPPQLARAPSLFERVNSIKLSFSRSENRDLVPVSTVHEDVLINHDQDRAHQSPEGSDFRVTRSKSDTGAKASSTAPSVSVVMKKSASEKVAASEKEDGRKLWQLGGGDEAVDARADDFIKRFRQQLKMQRLDSLLRTWCLIKVFNKKIIRNDSQAIRLASTDYGDIVHQNPSAVLYPSSINDITDLIKSSINNVRPFTIAARGNGHSVRGQAMASNGVVVNMKSLGEIGVRIRVSFNPSLGFYADVGGEQLWIDVLHETLKHGLMPVSWTDYVYLTVGGTLSNAGIGGQAFLHGPLISNVLELDVITGTGTFITCSKTKNSDLFFGVLGGLGQFGIITRARIILKKAPTRVKWVRLLYSDFSIFTTDQEHLISSSSPNYVEGFIVASETTPSSWPSFSSSTSDRNGVTSLLKNKGLLYTIELVKYYDDQSASTIDEEFQRLLQELNFIPGIAFNKDVPIFDFLTRVGDLENPETIQAHPWLNLFIPKSRIQDFNSQILVDMIPRFNDTNGLCIFYPLNKNKWDDRMSAVIPDEDVFYTIGLLHSSNPNTFEKFDELNNEILRLSEKAGIKVKQYLPYIKSKEDWVKHFGSKWSIFQKRKTMFDPKMILSRGQRIFNVA
ncbi:cytokinin dehydrogenase 2-like [Primulina huaijiensis]|uniref:cytokinin dehydrogenase 2-like n=1 Tax=Primulina huaijiensis TaxID=1492673 RepID=UPI003CC76463